MLISWGMLGTTSTRKQRLRRSPALRKLTVVTPKGTAEKRRGLSRPQRAIIDSLATRKDLVILVPHRGPAQFAPAGRGMKNTKS